jgi:hypothetical protein
MQVRVRFDANTSAPFLVEQIGIAQVDGIMRPDINVRRFLYVQILKDNGDDQIFTALRITYF